MLLALKVVAAGGLIVLLYVLSGIHVPLKYRILPCVFECVMKKAPYVDLVK